MRKTRNALWIDLMCVLLVLASSVSRAANHYFFEPETCLVHMTSGSFEWHLMMQNDVELCGYRFSILAPVSGITLFDPDTLTGDWTGTGVDIGGFADRTFQFNPAWDGFSGEAAGTSCPPGLEPGTYIAVRISGTLDHTAPYGLYVFAEDNAGNSDFTDETGDTFPVPVETGYMMIDGGMDLFVADCPVDPMPEETTVVITVIGQCTYPSHTGTLTVQCDVGMPEWADWNTSGDNPVTGTLTLISTFATGPWSGDFVFDYRCNHTGQHLYDSCHIDVVDDLGLFLRSDANADMDVEMSDAIFILKYLYVPGSNSLSCMDAGDSDDNGEITMSDAIYSLKYLYVPGSPQPPTPFPDCGVDPTADELGCQSHPCMGGGQAVRKKVGSVR